jgi:hypothetical protein
MDVQGPEAAYNPREFLAEYKIVPFFLFFGKNVGLPVLGPGFGILEQPMGAKNRIGIGFSYRPARLYRLVGRYDNSISS